MLPHAENSHRILRKIQLPLIFLLLIHQVTYFTLAISITSLVSLGWGGIPLLSIYGIPYIIIIHCNTPSRERAIVLPEAMQGLGVRFRPFQLLCVAECGAIGVYATHATCIYLIEKCLV